MLENLNQLEKIGLAFISGLVAGHALKEDKESATKNEKEIKVMGGKLEGKQAEKLMEYLKEMGVE